MKVKSIAFALVGLSVALGGCNRADNDRTTSIPRGVDSSALVVQNTPTGLSAPPAPAERGPIPPNANAVAPGTNAAVAMANEPNLQIQNGAEYGGEKVLPAAQEAAAKAPDTASADAAKAQTTESMMASNTTGTSPTARDTDANSPRSGNLTKQQEATEMPKAGQVNNHSSTALEKDSGR